MTPTLLTPHDPNPVEIYNESALDNNPILIVCDHASHVIPEKLKSLGLSNKDLSRHIALDIGAKMLGRLIADGLNSALIEAGFSRLVVDLNRDPISPSSMPEVSDGTLIPGNKDLDRDSRDARLNEIYHPYHTAISGCVKRIKNAGHTPFLISVHSFTPVYGTEVRRTEIGLLWNNNKNISLDFVDILRAQNPNIIADNNKPYSITEDPHVNHTILKHGFDEENNNLLVEIRQDLISDDGGVQKYAEIFLRAFKILMEQRIAKTL